MKPTAILLLHCPDQPGIISEITKFITDNHGNIVYLDQYVDREDGMFFMRIEWELENFLIPRGKIADYVQTLYAQKYSITFNLYFNDERPRMAIFVSKMSRRVERRHSLHCQQPRRPTLCGRAIWHTILCMVYQERPF